MADTPTVNSITELPLVVEVADQPCQRLYEHNPVLLGYDVVAYHEVPSVRNGGTAVRGLPQFAFNFQGYQFWFASEEHRALFVGDPWKYAPAWGGFCSWGMSRELPPDWPWAVDHLGPPASPWEGWFLYDGVLAFNIWSGFTTRFLNNADRNWNDAVERWKTFQNGTLYTGPFNTHCIGHGPLKNWCTLPQPAPWLEGLPTCTVTIGSSNATCHALVESGESLVDASCLADVQEIQGGGVVGEGKAFAHFPNEPEKASIHMIILIAISTIAVLVAIVRITGWLKGRRRRQRQEAAASQEDDDSFYHGVTSRKEEALVDPKVVANVSQVSSSVPSTSSSADDEK